MQMCISMCTKCQRRGIVIKTRMSENHRVSKIGEIPENGRMSENDRLLENGGISEYGKV